MKREISSPLDFRHTITVKHTKDDRIDLKTPPGSPAVPRYKAIARTFSPQFIINHDARVHGR